MTILIKEETINNFKSLEIRLIKTIIQIFIDIKKYISLIKKIIKTSLIKKNIKNYTFLIKKIIKFIKTKFSITFNINSNKNEKDNKKNKKD